MKRIATLSFVFLLSACAGVAVENPLYTQKDMDIARLQGMPTMDAVKEVENALVSAKRRQYDFFAPEHYRMANQALLEAKEFMVRNASHEQVVNKVAVADAVIRNSDLVVRNIKNILKEEIRQKETLERSNVQRHYGQEFDSLTDRLGQIIRQIENGKLAEASKQRPALRNDFDNLEMRAVVYDSLHEAREMLRRVKNSGGETLTPVTFREANEVLIRAEQYIQSNYKDKSAIKRVSDEALFASRRALYLTEEVAALSHKVSQSLEQLVLDEEYRLFRISRALLGRDIRDNPLEVQSEMIARSAGEIAAAAEEQSKLARMYKSQLDNDDEALARINAMNDAIKELDNERGQWQAKQALYEAKVGQLETALRAEEARQKTLLLEKEVLTQAFTQMSLREQLAENARLEAEKKEKSLVTEALTNKASVAEVESLSEDRVLPVAESANNKMLPSATPVLVSSPAREKNSPDAEQPAGPAAPGKSPLDNAIVDLSQ